MDNQTRLAFRVAKNLILEKKYHEARVLLGSIKHPKAREWIEKLDEISPIQEETRYIKPIELPKIRDIDELAQEYDYSQTLIPAPGQRYPIPTSQFPQREVVAPKKKSKSNGCLAFVALLILCSVSYNFLSNSSSGRQLYTVGSGGDGSNAERVLERIFNTQVDTFTDSEIVSATIPVSSSPSPGSSARNELNRRLIQAMCEMRASNYNRHAFEFAVTYGLADAGLGDTMPDIVLYILVSSRTAGNINCSTQNSVALSQIADDYSWEPGLER